MVENGGRQILDVRSDNYTPIHQELKFAWVTMASKVEVVRVLLFAPLIWWFLPFIS